MRRKLCLGFLCAGSLLAQTTFAQQINTDTAAAAAPAVDNVLAPAEPYIAQAAVVDTPLVSLGTVKDSLVGDLKTKIPSKPMSFKAVAIPVGMIAYGALAFTNSKTKKVNLFMREELWEDRAANGTSSKVRADDYMIYIPAATVYALNIAGVKGKNNFVDRTMIYAMSNLIANGVVFSAKGLTGVVRPDSSDSYSFPSGHTSAAFVSAEFLRQEYKDVSPWLGVAGYAIAAGTGFLRMYNNKHWFNDVIAGAGVGILSTRLSYWLYPKLKNGVLKAFGTRTVVAPTYQNGAFGVGVVHNF